MEYRLDDIDRRILYYLARDARNTSAPTIAEEVSVSPGTIRNRIRQLEENGVLTGYHAAIDYERVDGRLTNLFMCSTPVPDRETIARQVLDIPGVVNVRELMTGRRNLHVMAVGTDMSDISRISRDLSNLGVDIEDENLVQREETHPYQPFGPETEGETSTITDFLTLTGGAEVLELTVDAEAPVAGKTLRTANDEGLFGEELLVIAIERDDVIITPKGNATIEADDVVTLFSRGGISEAEMRAFSAA